MHLAANEEIGQSTVLIIFHIAPDALLFPLRTEICTCRCPRPTHYDPQRPSAPRFTASWLGSVNRRLDVVPASQATPARRRGDDRRRVTLAETPPRVRDLLRVAHIKKRIGARGGSPGTCSCVWSPGLAGSAGAATGLSHHPTRGSNTSHQGVREEPRSTASAQCRPNVTAAGSASIKRQTDLDHARRLVSSPHPFSSCDPDAGPSVQI